MIFLSTLLPEYWSKNFSHNLKDFFYNKKIHWTINKLLMLIKKYFKSILHFMPKD